MQGSDGIHSAEELLRLAREVLDGVGAPGAAAAVVAESLVESNLRGHDSHGVRRLVPYVRFVREGRLDPAAEPVVMRGHGAEPVVTRGRGDDDGAPRAGGAADDAGRAAERTGGAAGRATVVVDGRGGFGQVAARRATEELAATTRELGAGAAVVRRANHVGRLGEWVEALADEGHVALAFCNAEPIVAPYGGRERRLGTNPLAWAAPRRPPAPPLVMDWSTAAMPEGKVAVAKARRQHLPKDVLIDAHGEPTTNPDALYAGGALLPFGAHKGSGLSVMIQLIGGTLAGTGVFGEQGEAANGTVLLALDPTAFIPREDFDEETEAFCRALAGTKPAAGFDAVLVPGEIERRTRAHRAREGIPIPAATWSELTALKGGAPP